MDIGIYGMGRMGFNMARRKVDEAVAAGAKGAYSIEEFVSSQESPRVLWSMLPAGDTTDEMIQQFMQHANEGDIIVDGANSYFRDSVARAREVRNAGFRWLDAGVSGGVWGYDVGYGMLQAYAEGFEILQKSRYDYDLRALSSLWNQGSVVRSWLLELAENAFAQDANLDSVRGYVEDSGEGRWTVMEAIDESVPANAIAGSLFARFASRQDDSFAMKVLAALRGQFGGHAIQEASTRYPEQEQK